MARASEGHAKGVPEVSESLPFRGGNGLRSLLPMEMGQEIMRFDGVKGCLVWGFPEKTSSTTGNQSERAACGSTTRTREEKGIFD